MKALTAWLVLTLGLAPALAEAHQRSWPGKRLAEAMPEAKKFTQKQVVLGTAQIEWIEKTLGSRIGTEDKNPTFYIGTGSDGRTMGVVFFLDVAGENGEVEMGVAMTPAAAVQRVVLYEHSEPSSVASKEFLSKLEGKKAADPFRVGEDVKAPAGAEKSAQALATGVRRALLIAMAGLRLGTK
ncbi:MAG: hypothetical protein ACOZIN_19190 [Myxococcota bacterium]